MAKSCSRGGAARGALCKGPWSLVWRREGLGSSPWGRQHRSRELEQPHRGAPADLRGDTGPGHLAGCPLVGAAPSPGDVVPVTAHGMGKGSAWASRALNGPDLSSQEGSVRSAKPHEQLQTLPEHHRGGRGSRSTPMTGQWGGQAEPAGSGAAALGVPDLALPCPAVGLEEEGHGAPVQDTTCLRGKQVPRGLFPVSSQPCRQHPGEGRAQGSPHNGSSPSSGTPSTVPHSTACSRSLSGPRAARCHQPQPQHRG